MKRTETLCSTILLLLLASAVFSYQSQKITGPLQDELLQAQADEKISCIVTMKKRYNHDAVRSLLSAREKIARYKQIARQSREPVLAWLAAQGDRAEVQQKYWTFNGFHVKATPSVIYALTEREDVLRCGANEQLFTDGTVSAKRGTTPTRGIAWGVRKIQADKCWEQGYTGKGVVIGIIDGGVQYEHPALEDKWSGYWIATQGLDPSPTPYDLTSHGSHCLGSIVGGDGPGPFEQDIGVAPGAKYAAGATMLKLDQCFEALDYMASLSDSCNIRAVSNSWTAGSNPGNVPDYIEINNTMLSLGILNVYCNGNHPSNPGPGSVWMCASVPNVIGVGNTDSLDNINPSSMLGPSADKEPWTNTEYWLRDDWDLIKPNIAAPGTDIWSCTKDSDYIARTGTSMATPHVAGVIALIAEKNPDLTPREIYDILLRSTDQPAANGPYPNNTFGWGRLNALKALELTSTPIQYQKNSTTLKALSLSTCQRQGIVKVSFSLLHEQEVKIGIIDAKGKRIADIVNARYLSGDHEVRWNTKQATPGLYLCRLSAGKVQVTQKIILVK